MYQRIIFFMLACTMCIQASCKKDKVSKPDTIPPVSNLLYADSVFYIRDAVNNNLVAPLAAIAGTFTCAPEGLKIDENTGAIDVNNSETGLKYKVTFTSADAVTIKSAYITISGINYMDKIYNLSLGDSIAAPVYNADYKIAIPQINNGTNFDVNSGCKDAGIEVDPANAKINLAKSVRDQRIDTGSTKEVKLQYKINDQSNGALNGLAIKIYFYTTASEIPQYLTDLLNQRKNTILSTNLKGISLMTSPKGLFALSNNVKKPVRPRPPCIIVVSR